jgi:type II secretory pathway predicted ATPase ExeA
VKYKKSVRLREQPTTYDQNQSRQAALTFLQKVMADERGVGLLHGPESSGKSELIEQFVQELKPTVAVAVVNGARLKTPQLLAGILEQFGYRVELNSTDELLNMLRVIIVQQTRSNISPVLIVQNIKHMYPSALCVLCKLAAQKVHSRFALRIVLVGDRYFRRIIKSPSMRSIADRLVGDFELQAPPEPEVPKLIVTLYGETLQKFELVKSRALIGRSDLGDIVCDGEFVSRRHALLIRDKDSIVIIDLKSRNGTFVNSHRVTSKVLRDSDIVVVGDHRIKLDFAGAQAEIDLEGLGIADTTKMRSIPDARHEEDVDDLSGHAILS